MEKTCQKCGKILTFNGYFGRTLNFSDVITEENEHLVDAYVFYCSNESCKQKGVNIYLDKNGNWSNDPMHW